MEGVDTLISDVSFLYFVACNLAVEPILDVLQSDRGTSRR